MFQRKHFDNILVNNAALLNFATEKIQGAAMFSTSAYQLLEKKKTRSKLTVLALVPLVACCAAAGWLVAHVDRALAAVEAVVLACLSVTGGPSEAFGASAGGSTWEGGEMEED